MPLSSGLSTHDDTKHKGDAKRNVVGGVAPLDAAGNVEDMAGNDCETVNHKNAINGYAGLDGDARLPFVELPETSNEYVLDNAVLQAHDAVASTGATSYIKAKEITIDTLKFSPADVRVRFDLLAVGNWGYGQLRLADSSVLASFSIMDAGYTNYGGDYELVQGDVVSLWYRCVAGTVSVRNFQIRGVAVKANLVDAIRAGNIGLPVPLVASNTYP